MQTLHLGKPKGTPSCLRLRPQRAEPVPEVLLLVIYTSRDFPRSDTLSTRPSRERETSRRTGVCPRVVPTVAYEGPVRHIPVYSFIC